MVQNGKVECTTSLTRHCTPKSTTLYFISECVQWPHLLMVTHTQVISNWFLEFYNSETVLQWIWALIEHLWDVMQQETLHRGCEADKSA